LWTCTINVTYPFQSFFLPITGNARGEQPRDRPRRSLWMHACSRTHYGPRRPNGKENA
jgi:hypothetical protein